MNLETPPPNFQYLLFERVDPEYNVARFYYLGYLPTLFGRAVVRVWGRKDGAQQILCSPPYETLEAAWPELRRHIKARLRHGYVVVGPEGYREQA